jgi:hypothetical protein
VTASEGPEVYLFELGDANLGTYSPTRFVKAATADEIADRIRENKDHLDQVAVVSPRARGFLPSAEGHWGGLAGLE